MFLDIEPYVEQYGYWAIFGAVLLEDFGLPVPGETSLIIGAIYASQGTLNIVWVLLIAWVAAVVGDNIGYWIGRWLGRRLVVKYGKYVLITDKRLAHAESFFRKHGPIIVVVARFIEILRQLNGLAAGTTRMQWRQFFIYNMIGGALWVLLWGLLFYFLGETLGKTYQKYLYLFFAGGAAIWIIIALIFWLRRRHKKKKQQNGENDNGDEQ
jgi:membrane protein DedA with SNARE-associated domain